MSDHPIKYFIRSNGIDIAVLAAYIGEFADSDARIEWSSDRDNTGYLISSKNKLQPEDIEALRNDTVNWDNEKRRYGAPENYLDSESWRKRCILAAQNARRNPIRENDRLSLSQSNLSSNIQGPRNSYSPYNLSSNTKVPRNSYSPYNYLAENEHPEACHSKQDIGARSSTIQTVPPSKTQYAQGRHAQQVTDTWQPQYNSPLDSPLPSSRSLRRNYPLGTDDPLNRHSKTNHRSNTVGTGEGIFANGLRAQNTTNTEISSHRKVGFSERSDFPAYLARYDARVAGYASLPRHLEYLKVSDGSSDALSCDSDSTDTTLGSLFQVSLGDLEVECMVDSGSHGNFISEELLSKMLSRMPEKHRDVKPYWSLRQYVSAHLGVKKFDIVGKISLNPEWHIEDSALSRRKDIVFMIVEDGQLAHDMIVTWKTAQKSGINLGDHKKGARCKKSIVATIPSAGLPKRSKEERKRDETKKAAKKKLQENREREREKAARPERHLPSGARR